MELPFKLTDSLDVDSVHQFRVYEVLDKDNHEWLLPLAQEYIKLLTYRERSPKKIEQVVSGIDMDTTYIKRCLLKDSIPKSRGGNFDVIRSDFGELLCYMLLERDYKTLFGWKSLCWREDRNLTARGIDAIGVEYNEADTFLTLVICEVKVSDDNESPPGVVDANKDSLKKQHIDHVSKLYEDTRAKVRRHARLTRDPNAESMLDAVVQCLEAKRLDLLRIVVCNILVRPTARYKTTDFGSFRKMPVIYQPASIRFLIPCIPDNVDVIIDKWRSLLQTMEVSV